MLRIAQQTTTQTCSNHQTIHTATIKRSDEAKGKSQCHPNFIEGNDINGEMEKNFHSLRFIDSVQVPVRNPDTSVTMGPMRLSSPHYKFTTHWCS